MATTGNNTGDLKFLMKNSEQQRNSNTSPVSAQSLVSRLVTTVGFSQKDQLFSIYNPSIPSSTGPVQGFCCWDVCFLWGISSLSHTQMLTVNIIQQPHRYTFDWMMHHLSERPVAVICISKGLCESFFLCRQSFSARPRQAAFRPETT